MGSKFILDNNIKKYRKELGLSQADLANLVGVTRQTINVLEANKYNPSLELSYKIANVFNKKIEEVFIYIDEQK